MANSKIKVTLVKSVIGNKERYRKTVKSLGLGKINSSSIHDMNPSVAGKLNQIAHLVRVEEVK